MDQPTLEELRNEIDSINKKIILLLARRMSVTQQIAALKKREQKPIHDMKREEEILRSVSDDAKVHGLDEAFVRRIFSEIMEHTKVRESEVR
jgi:chorismate mutase